jgi:uncharacterized membrane protein YeaQ/YmgE (transglycosylase-associated protein family)
MVLDPQSLLIWIVIGAVAGWLAGQIMRGGGYGLIGDVIVGILGAVIAGALFPRLGLATGSGLLGTILAATIGACLLIFILRLINRGA